MTARPRALLLRTCVAEVLGPEVVDDATALLEACGDEVVSPGGQTCCGQPAWNAGFADEAARVAGRTLTVLDRALRGDDVVVVPAGSCATMAHHYWPELFRLTGDAELEAAARRVAPRVRELTQHLAGRELPPLTSGGEAVALHHSCHLLRELDGRDAPGSLLSRVAGCEVAEWSSADAERCCGFGGTFSLKLPEVAEAMADEKLRSFAATGARTLVGADLSCLLHLRARAEATGVPVEVRHVASVAAQALADEAPRTRRAPPAPDPAPPGREPAARPDTLRGRTAVAVADPVLRSRLAVAVDRFDTHRAEGLAELEDADGLRSAARGVKGALLAELPDVLEDFADSVLALGGHVCWARTAAEADAYIAEVVRAEAHGGDGRALVVKSKSMATEEIGLNRALEAAGCEVVETDLGEWIVQLAGERPSHIIAPAIHHDRHSIRDLFVAGPGADPTQLAAVPEELNAYARGWLRERFLRADVGITGANFGVAESGSIVLVTNEGNGRLVTSVPRVHVAVVGMERVVRDWSQLDLLLTLLTRSATGQRLTSYTSVVTGPRRDGDGEGPEELHVVLLDNGRSGILGGELHEMLACIRCGACLNTCPVYRQVGGHAYGGVYPGPMGAVLTPLLEQHRPGASETPDASTLCGACMKACPVEIPLQDLLLALRRRKAPGAPAATRLAWRAWAALWSRPAGYALTRRLAPAARLAAPLLRLPPVRRRVGGRALPLPPRQTRGARRG